MSIPRLPFIGITIAALALAIAAGSFALAGALGAGPAAAEGDGDDRGAHHNRGDYDKGAALAEALGVTVEELEAAKRQAALDRIAAAVADGELSEERADALREAIESGERRGHMRGFRGHGFGFGWHDDEGDKGAAFAEALGVTVEELEAAMREVALDKIDAAVESGRLSEERAEAMREAIESGEPFGRERFDRGHRGRGFGFPKGDFDGFGSDGAMTAEERQQAMLDRLDAAVEAGMLSAEQADALRTLIESADGDGWRGFGFGGRGFHRGHR